MWESGLHYYPASEQFSRQQVQTRTGVSDDVLAFWIKQGLLVALPALPRAHRRFSYEQLHIAVVLNAMRSLGANVGILRIFAEALQEGTAIQGRVSFSDDELSAAASLRRMIETFDSGGTVMIYDYSLSEEQEAQARNIEDVILSWRRREQLEGSAEALAEFARNLTPSEARSLEYALTLNSPSHLLTNRSGVKWIAWIDEGGAPRFAHSDEAILEREGGPNAAFYIPISRLIRNLWPERIERAVSISERTRSFNLAQHVLKLQATNPEKALRMRLKHNLPEDCEAFIAQLEREAFMDP